MSMYDVVVVGAGPAGSVAAYHASRGGLRVLLLDRARFPRPKTCGDVLSPRALAAIARMGLVELPGQRVQTLRIIHGPSGAIAHERFDTHGSPHHGLVLSREILDALLVERACAAGAELAEGHALRLRCDDGQVTGVVATTGAGTVELRARAVIGAAGSAGGSILPLALRRRRPSAWGIAGRAYFELAQPLGQDLHIHVPLANDGHLFYGYGWLFPMGGNCVNVGVGIVRNGTRNTAAFRMLVERFFEWLGRQERAFAGAVRVSSVTTAPIAMGPLGGAVPGFLPVGDMAGVVNPFTGEGIAAAIESGETAAQSLLAAGDPTAEYETRLHRSLRRHFTLAQALPALHRHPSALLGRGWDVVCGRRGTSAEAVRQLIWDEKPRIRTAPPPEGAEAARADLVAAIRRIRPLLGEIVARLTEAPEMQFGWYAAFASAVRQPAGIAAPHERRIVLVLEILNVVTRLQAELQPPKPQRGPGVWGRNTLALVVADCLTAHALRLLYSLPADWAAALGGDARASFRSRVSPIAAHGADTTASDASLFVAAARAGLGARPGASLPAEVVRAARALASVQKDPGAVVAEATTVLARLPTPWASHVAALLDLARRNASPEIPPCGC